MSDKFNNLFVWKNYKGFISKDENKDISNLKYWQSKTAEVTDNAIKNVLLTSNITVETNKNLVDDTVYNEAKNLVKGWLTNKKVYGDFSDRQSFLHLSGDEADYSVPTRSEIHKEWEHLVKKIETKEDYKAELDDYLTSDRSHIKEDQKLKSIMSNLHKKTFVDSSKLSKIDSSKSVDMKKRIENRQEEVKRKRDERNKKEEIMRLEKLAEKEARIEAMKMLKEEKKLKELSIKKEEELLQIEMNKIRIELQKKREQDMLEQKKLREIQEMLKNQEKQINSSRKLEEATQKLQSKINKNTNERFEIIAELVEKKFLNKNLQLIRKCFRAWKKELENTEIKMEKAKVWFDFKNSRKVFRAWSNYSRFIKFNTQIDIEQQRIKLLQMKENMASEFYKRNLFKKCILHWSLYVIDEKESRWCQKLEEMRKKKMVDYINALQEKALENQEKLENLQSVSNINKIKDTNFDQTLSQRTYINENAKLSARNDLPSQNQCKSARSHSAGKRPKEAWQVTKKDVYLPLDKLIDNLGQDRKSTESPNYRKYFKPPKVVNSYACRDAAQKELIKQQQAKIKEQQRLIEEIKTTNLLKNIKETHQHSIIHAEIDNQNSALTNYGDDINSPIPDLQNTKYRNKFVIQMEARTIERERIKAERLERQRLQEEEKKKKLEEKLAEQAKLELEEKVKREKLLKEKKEKERQKEDAKQKRLKWERECNEKADNFYKKVVLKHYGVQKWKILLTIKNQNIEKADNNYEITLMKKVFLAWRKDTQEHNEYLNKIVKNFYYEILLRRCFHHMKLFKHRYELMELSAEEHYLNSLMKRFFQRWRITNHRQQIRLDKLAIQCDCLYERSLMKKSFNIWRQLPMAKRQERERERRIDAMRQKVATIIPDFKPVILNKD